MKSEKCLRKDCYRKDKNIVYSYLKIYNIRMKTIKELKIKDLYDYCFKEMVNILEIDPGYFMINDFKGCKDGSTIFNLCYYSEDSVPHIIFSNIKCIF